MRWEDERYVRVYTRDTAELLALGWEARALLWEILRKVDRAGILALGKTGARGLAAVTQIPFEVVERALPILLDDGCVTLGDGVLVVRNYIAAQTTPQSDKARQTEKRARDRDRALSQNVTPPSQNVTDSHAASRAVTDGHAASLCAVLDYAGLDPSGGRAAPPVPAPRPTPKPSKPKPDREPDTLPGIDLDAKPDPKPETAEGVGWRTWRAAYHERYRRTYPKQSSDGPAMKRLVKLAVDLVAELRREEPDAVELLLAHRWRKYLADPGQSRTPGGPGYLAETCHRLQDIERGLAAYGTPWDRAAQPKAPTREPAIAPPRRPVARVEMADDDGEPSPGPPPDGPPAERVNVFAMFGGGGRR